MLLTISKLHASIENKEVLRGVTMTVRSGEVHAVMGPNGGGKSTLAYALLGHPAYSVSGKITLNKKNISRLSTQQRASRGLFLALQSPIAVPGVTVTDLLRSALGEGKKRIANPILARRMVGSMPIGKFMEMLKSHAKTLHIDESFLSRGINDGFSGGEKKKMEMLQALMLAPKFAVFDEIDTGLDVDALKVVARGVSQLAKAKTGIVIVTHYQRILRYVKPDVVHVLVAGKIVKAGGSSLAKEIERHGYSKYTV